MSRGRADRATGADRPATAPTVAGTTGAAAGDAEAASGASGSLATGAGEMRARGTDGVTSPATRAAPGVPARNVSAAASGDEAMALRGRAVPPAGGSMAGR